MRASCLPTSTVQPEVGEIVDRSIEAVPGERQPVKRQWLEATEQTVLPKSPLGQALQYVLPRWEGLARYCENGSLGNDNNLSDRMVRPVAIGRKNYLFLGSDNGGTAAAVLYRMIGQVRNDAAIVRFQEVLQHEASEELMLRELLRAIGMRVEWQHLLSDNQRRPRHRFRRFTGACHTGITHPSELAS